jgi:hypothetical protein
MGRSSDNKSYLTKLLGPLGGDSFASRAGTIVLLFVGLTIGSIVVWHQWGRQVVQAGDMSLSREKIHITPQPTWIRRTDVLADVAGSASLDQLSFKQPNVTVHVADAFSTHPWVAKVRRCSKTFPGELTVDLEYRRPVAMVRVPLPNQPSPGVLPVDEHGVLLPTVDFDQTQTQTYPRIFAEIGYEKKVAGAPWGDPRIHAGARVAAMLAPVWQPLELFAIRCDLVKRQAGISSVQIELRTQKDTRIWWGSPPGAEGPSEPQADVKIARLREFQAERGSLDKVPPDQMIDLTRSDRLYVARAEQQDRL